MISELRNSIGQVFAARRPLMLFYIIVASVGINMVPPIILTAAGFNPQIQVVILLQTAWIITILAALFFTCMALNPQSEIDASLRATLVFILLPAALIVLHYAALPASDLKGVLTSKLIPYGNILLMFCCMFMMLGTAIAAEIQRD